MYTLYTILAVAQAGTAKREWSFISGRISSYFFLQNYKVLNENKGQDVHVIKPFTGSRNI